MDKILSLLLCCTIGSPEHSLTSTTTASSRNTSDALPKTDEAAEPPSRAAVADHEPVEVKPKLGEKLDEKRAEKTTEKVEDHDKRRDDSASSEPTEEPAVAEQILTASEQYYSDYFDLEAMQPDQVVLPSGWLLDKRSPSFEGKKCLVLDLDETLVHLSFKYLRLADFVIPVEIEGQVHNVYVIKRPGVDEFMKRVGELYEVVVFTASVSRYGDPLLDELDIHKSVHHRLFRDSCFNYQGNYIKNLSQIGRPLSDLIIIDNLPASYIFHPQHAVPISSWFSDAHDNELLDLLPFLEDLLRPDVDDVGLVLDVTTS